jgi:hypothetical protein
MSYGMANTGNRVFNAHITRSGPTNTKNRANMINSTTKFVVLFILQVLQSLQLGQFLLYGPVLAFSSRG